MFDKYIYDKDDPKNIYITEFEIESANKDEILRQREEGDHYEHRMLNHTPDIDEFIIKEFSDNGMHNIYGKDQQIFKDSDNFK